MVSRNEQERKIGSAENITDPSPASPAGLTRGLRDIAMLAQKTGQTGAAAVASECADIIEALADRVLTLEAEVPHLRHSEVSS
jgi:hypothetical protein